MANWIQRQGVWYNQPNLCSMRVQQDQTDGQWHVAYSFDGATWAVDFQGFPTQAAAQTFLNNYASGLG